MQKRHNSCRNNFCRPGLGTVTEDNPMGYETWSFARYDANGTETEIGEAEWNSYIDGLTEITFTEIE